MTVKELIEHLKQNYAENDVVAYDLWTINDVQNEAKRRGVEITKEQAVRILNMMNKDNWLTVNCAIDEILESENKKQTPKAA